MRFRCDDWISLDLFTPLQYKCYNSECVLPVKQQTSLWWCMLDISTHLVCINPSLYYNHLQAHIQICLHPINNWWVAPTKSSSYIISFSIICFTCMQHVTSQKKRSVATSATWPVSLTCVCPWITHRCGTRSWRPEGGVHSGLQGLLRRADGPR